MQCPEAWQTGTCCTVWLQPVDCGTVAPPQSKLVAEVGSKAFGEKEETKTFFICPFIKQELLHDNTVFISD